MNKLSESLSKRVPVPGSFRDPKGRVARSGTGEVFRYIAKAGSDDFDAVEKSGLYTHLIEQEKLVAHKRVTLADDPEASAYEILLQHSEIPVISYPYEWCFQQMKDAALLQPSHPCIGIVRDSGPLNDPLFLNAPLQGSTTI